MKSKPKIFNPSDPVEVKFVATIYDLLTKGFEMSSIYRCGNCDYILHASNINRPKVCGNCGTEIDWIGNYTMIIKECPQCHVQYDNLKNFCLNCVPPNKLQQLEIDIPKKIILLNLLLTVIKIYICVVNNIVTIILVTFI